MKQIKWYTLYAKFAKCLYEFYDEYKEKSGELLYQTYIQKDENLKILPWIKNFKQYKVTSIDPIHIFASFNYWKIPVKMRKERIKLFCELIKINNIDINNLLNEIEETNLDVFKYFPHINITYIVSARDNNQQNEVWEFFSLIHKNKQNERFEELFNKINDEWFGVKLQSATIFMFWVNSDNFLALDKNTYSLLKEYDVLNTFPNLFDQYKKLLEINGQNLYRNLVRIAIDRQFKTTLTKQEQQQIEKFLRQNFIEIVSKKEKQKISSLDIELIDDLNFELYFIIDGKAKRIIYKDNKINYTTLSIQNQFDTVSYPNFQLIAIRALDNKYTKVLEPEKLYYFNKNFEIESDTLKAINEKSVSIYKTGSINNINISAIVGKNGTGKSTIIELLIMALNNIAKILQDNEHYTIKELENLFYTIYTNYSLHFLNEKYYHGKWLHKLFHKNDAYQTPIVIEPYRDKGNIDINTLDKLTKQRLLATLLEPSVENEKEHLKLTNKQYATHINIKVNIDKIKNIIASNSTTSDFKDNIDKFLYLDENKNILDYFLEKIQDNEILYNKIAKVYICYKVKNIANTYQIYHKYKDKIDDIEYLKQLTNDKSHITFKLHQALNFFKYNTVKKIGKVKIDEISSSIRDIKALNSKLKTIELIPPAFFDIDIIMDDDKPFDLLSSGEKQKIYTTSSIIYHLQNIESVHRSSSNNIKYKYVNLILDEIELYFHPDMQRTFISDLLNAIENNSALDNIVGLNIILVTHSPFILSDIFKEQILYLTDTKDKTSNLDTFGANIHTLLNDSFFMENGLMGECSKKIIEDIIIKLNNEKNKNKTLDVVEKNYIKQVISNIGEPFLKKKLFDMYFSLFDEKENQIAILKREMNSIQEKIEKLEK